jgi:hypothetical protein
LQYVPYFALKDECASGLQGARAEWYQA